jgi:serine/threonine-protein kinase
VGEHEGRVYLAFEFLHGQSLRAEIAGRQMNVRRALDIGIQIADAIAEAHGAGFLHGGLSADSVVITAKGHAKIPAFELAARAGFVEVNGQSRLRDYESPEEGRGERPDERSDVYSVGAVMYEMLTTRRPLARGSAAPSAANPHIPTELDEIVLKAAAPNPSLRFQSAAGLAAELRSVAAIIDVRGGVGDDDEPQESAASVTRVLLIAVAIIAAVAAVAWWLTRS